MATVVLLLAPAGRLAQDQCARFEAEAEATANMRDADATAGLARAEALIASAKAAGCRRAEVHAQAARGDNLLMLGRYQESQEIYRLATRALEPDGPSPLLASVRRRAGAAYYYMGELDHALQEYRASLAVAEQIGERTEAAKALGNIGALYVKIGWLDEALEVQERALANFEQVGSETGIAGTAINVSQVHGELGDRATMKGDAEGARTHYQAMYSASRQAFAQFRSIGNARGVATSSANVGIAAAALGRYDEAIGWHERALALRKEIGDAQGEVNSLGTMAVALIGLGRLDAAEESLIRADLLVAGMSPSDRKLIAESWAQLLRARGDYIGALERMTDVLSLSEEIAGEDYGTRVKELETRYRTERMEQQISIADLQLARQRLWLTLALITFALLTVLAVVLLRAFRASRRAARDLQHAVRTDYLTGLTNRLGVYERIEYERLRSERTRSPFSLALIDLDDFKVVNDRYGHETGDAVLVQVARQISSQLRAQDTAARWGGEEFLLLLPDTGASGAVVIASKIREAVRSAPVRANGDALALTLTIGLCQYRTELTISQCIKHADEAMYAGKTGGKNRVILSGP